MSSGALLRATVFLVSAGLIWGQFKTTAELGGVITDPSDAPVLEAKLSATREGTGETRVILTNERGEYRFLSLTPGTYDFVVEKAGFQTETRRGLVFTVGQTASIDFKLSIGTRTEIVEVRSAAPLIEPERTQQANTILQQSVRTLPIDRRDYLTFTLLAPGVADAKVVADGNNYRVKQVPSSGLSFYGSNGRGNSIGVDGGESNDGGGGVRPTVSQEAVQEFQIDRTNYSAEFGSARGGVINIITRSGTNSLHGSVFGFFNDASLNATNPFAIELKGNQPTRVKPDSSRQQFGASLGGPIIKDRTFFFAAYERVRRRESAAVPLLTDLSIFQPTPSQEAILQTLPSSQAAPLRAALTSSPSTVAMFQNNSGVFPYQTDSHQGFWRIDHRLNSNNQVNFRYNISEIYDTNPNLAALVGVSRGYVQDFFDSTAAASWTHVFSPLAINEARVQTNYLDERTSSRDPFGPAIDIGGFGFFNRDKTLPSDVLGRREELMDNLSIAKGAHSVKLGVYTLIRQNTVDSLPYSSGRFTFGTLPGAFVSPALASTSITALQAFNLGLAQSYQQGFGSGVSRAIYPLYAGYAQDAWRVRRDLTLNIGLRADVDQRKAPLPTNFNVAPRFGFAWSPDSKTVVRGGYGLFYATIDFQVDAYLNAFQEVNGYRQIDLVLSVLDAKNPTSPSGPINIFKTLKAQGVIGVPTPQSPIREGDLSQFGIPVTHTGPLPPNSVLFRNLQDYKRPNAQQASFEIERQALEGVSVSVGYVFSRGTHLTNSSDANLLEAPINPLTGIRDWGVTADNPTGTKYFANPLILQDNLYTSTANSWYNGMTVEGVKRFSGNLSVNFNYTFSKAIDESADFNTDFQPNDQTCRQCERALSSFDERHKVVLYALVEAPVRTNVTGLRRLMNGFSFSPIFRYNSPRPFNLLAGTDLNHDRHSTTDRPYFTGRNTGIGPSFMTLDARLTRQIRLNERARLELTFEAFNLFNKLNYSSVNNTVGALAPPDPRGRDDRTPSQPLGFTAAFDPRRIQLGARLSF